MKISFVLLLTGILSAAPAALQASTYYVDAARGNDSNAGTSQSAAWKTLGKVNAGHYEPGDRILLRAGSRWSGQLVLSSSGSARAPICVDKYGKGHLPRIDGNGTVENVVQLVNVEEVEVRHLELTNQGGQRGLRRGVLVAVHDFGTAHHLVIGDLFIHDIEGTNQRKDNGGIVFRTDGATTPSRFDDLLIERNIVWKVDRSAIVGESSEFPRSKWYPSLHVVIRDNYADDIGGDGIVPWVTDGALIEHNIVMHCNQRASSYNAGIWPWSTDNSVFQLNESAYAHSTFDSEGFDSDYNSRNTHFLYNYSHDNDGGFMLICTPGKRNQRENIGNIGTVIRYNISRNDHARIFNLSGADQTTVEHNAIYIAPDDDVQVLLVSDWEGWATGALFRENTFDAAGTGRYGHQLQHNQDGTYQIGPGWGGAKDIQFQGNRYWGHQVDLPVDSGAEIDPHYHPAKLNWREPVFNPEHPERFSAFLTRHRQWMFRLFADQFGTQLQLQGADSESKSAAGN